ncbi:MAG: hypothetical protein ACTS42_02000 [Candidatus Hodgkinia cicadicola]
MFRNAITSTCHKFLAKTIVHDLSAPRSLNNFRATKCRYLLQLFRTAINGRRRKQQSK